MKKHQLPATLRTRTKTREEHLAAAFLREMPYRCVEWTTRDTPDQRKSLAHFVGYTVATQVEGKTPAEWERDKEHRVALQQRILEWMNAPLPVEVETRMRTYIEQAKAAHAARKAAHALKFRQSA